MAEIVHLPSRQVAMTARIKELRHLIKEHNAEIFRLEQEAGQLEYQRSISAPHGIFLHRRGDGSEVEADAMILETEGDAIYIEYRILRSPRRGEEDGYLKWLRTPEELARFTLSAR